ncbi:MAG: hypothetical protein IPG76_02740 [Acidobacteria bacterium]|nr:hypothetical protein [Acidobacteriota bacterium]
MQKRANPNAEDAEPNKARALLNMMISGNVQAEWKPLIAAGADLQAKNKQGQMALDISRSNNHDKMVSLLSGSIAAR